MRPFDPSRKLTAGREWPLWGDPFKSAEVRFWPKSAGDIGLCVGGTSDTNAADDDNNLCDNSCRQAIEQAFQHRAAGCIRERDDGTRQSIG